MTPVIISRTVAIGLCVCVHQLLCSACYRPINDHFTNRLAIGSIFSQLTCVQSQAAKWIISDA